MREGQSPMGITSPPIARSFWNQTVTQASSNAMAKNGAKV